MLPPNSCYVMLKECKKTVGNKESEISPFVQKKWWYKERLQLLQRNIVLPKITGSKCNCNCSEKHKDVHILSYYPKLLSLKICRLRTSYESSKAVVLPPSYPLQSFLSSADYVKERLKDWRTKKKEKWGTLWTTQQKPAELVRLCRLINDSPAQVWDCGCYVTPFK